MKSLVEVANPIQQVNIIRHLLPREGNFPNNGHLALMVYRNAFRLDEGDIAKSVEQIFKRNGWSNAWVDGVYDFHHYHSITHEVLGVIEGSTRIQFGGPSGISLLVEAGDVIVIPAGVAHKNLGGEENFKCVGAYPEGKNYDMNYGKPEERAEADKNIKSVPLPERDPVFGMNGPLTKEWVNQPDEISEVI